MNIKEFKKVLSENIDKFVLFRLRNEQIPEHYHITEVGKETRSFVDCGGTKRQTEKCVLQAWVANDLDHRLKSEKLLKIIGFANDLFENDNIEVYLEYELETVSQYPVIQFQTDEEKIFFQLGTTHTACLAPEKCGVECAPQKLVNLTLK